MTDDISPEGRNYLTQLEAALGNLPRHARSDIISGIREELTGLSPAETRQRIEAMGDPEFVAAEALRESGAARDGRVPAAIPAAAPKRRASESPAFAIVAALLVMIGGLVIPVIGALAGYVMMWISKAWTTRDKVFATLLPIVVGVGVALAVGFASRPSADPVNPLMPVNSFGSWHVILLAIFPGFFVAGAWLLWRSARLRVAED